jgi:hypothetical protein
LAGADINASMESAQHGRARRAIDESFVSAFRSVMIAAFVLALGAAVAGGLIREQRPRVPGRSPS